MKFLIGFLGVLGALVLFAGLSGSERRIAEAAPVTFEVQALGANEIPAVSGPGSAFGRFTFDKDTKVLTYAVTVSGLSPNLVTAAHIHRGAVGVNGPIVHTLSATGFTQISGTITLSDADVADLEAGRFYLNVHSTDNPGGFARGQLILPSAAPSQPSVRPPSTGDAGLLDEESSRAGLLIAAALAVASLGAWRALLRRG